MENLAGQLEAELDAGEAVGAIEEPAYVAYMALQFGAAYEIVDPALTDGNCHGLTFGGGGDQFIRIGSIEVLIALLGWNGNWVRDSSADVLICFNGDLIAHSASKAGAVWRQTLPGGPIFTSTKAVLDGKYSECLDLSTRPGRQKLQDRLDEIAALRARLIALCRAGTGDEGLQPYLAGWEAEVGETAPVTLRDRIDQIEETL